MSKAVSLKSFVSAHGLSALATGVHLVAMAWLALTMLHLSSLKWGFIQAAALLPNLLFMLYAGALADRVDPARILAFAQGALSISYGALACALFVDALSFPFLIAYALVVGASNAFLQPAREKLIALVQSNTLQQRISMLSIAQFSFQGLGMLVVAISHFIAIQWVIAVQCVLSIVASIMFLGLVDRVEVERGQIKKPLDEMMAAIRFVAESKTLRQLMALVAFNGYMHMGVFVVLVPIIATKTYQHSSAEYASLQLLFLLGMITAHVALYRQKMVEFPGQGALFSLLYTAMVGFGLSKGPTPLGFYALIFFWGVVAGNSAGRCRLVLQTMVEPEFKGRAMAVYQLCLFGVAPIGAMATGLVMNFMSIAEIFLFMSVSSVVLFMIFMMTRSIWSVRVAP